MHPLALISLIIGVFTLSVLSLAGLALKDWLDERRARLSPPHESLQLELQPLIDELTSFASAQA